MFKVTKKDKISEHEHNKSVYEESDKEKANIVKKLNREHKYRVKFPFKYFNCGKVRHFAAKFPYPKEYSKDEYDTNKQYKKKGKYHYKKMNYKGKKST